MYGFIPKVGEGNAKCKMTNDENAVGGGLPARGLNGGHGTEAQRERKRRGKEQRQRNAEDIETGEEGCRVT